MSRVERRVRVCVCGEQYRRGTYAAHKRAHVGQLRSPERSRLIIDRWNADPLLQQKDLVREFGVSRFTVSDVLREADPHRRATCVKCHAVMPKQQMQNHMANKHPRKVIEHGSRTMYGYYGCRCEACRQVSRRHIQSLRSRGEAPNHGTPSGYNNYGCRCPACKEAGRITNRRFREQRKQRQAA